MNKRYLAIVLAVIAVFSLFAIAEDTHDKHLTVVATNGALYEIAGAVGNGHLNVVLAEEASAELAADIVLCTGSEEDAWAREIAGAFVICAAESIQLIEGEWDLYTVPINNMLVAVTLSDALTGMDEAHAEVYLANMIVYCDQMSALDLDFREALAKDAKIFCADGSMAYFAAEYGVQIAESEENAIVLSVHPTVEGVTYAQLLQSNLEAIQAFGK